MTDPAVGTRHAPEHGGGASVGGTGVGGAGIGRDGDGHRSGHRPPPRPTSLAGAAAGVLLVTSLVLALSELSGDRQRLAGVGISLLFEALGVGLLVLGRHRRAAAAGVVLTAIGVVPLLVYLFVDVRNPANTIDDVGSFTSTATLVLLISAALWLVAYVAGPGRRHGFYLGAALVALWLVAVVQIVDSPLSQFADGFAAGPVAVDETFDSETFDSESSTEFDDEFSTEFDDELSTEFDDEFGQGFDDELGEGFPIDPGDGFPQPDDPSGELGWASLGFGLTYLALGAARDRRGDHRQATVLLAVCAPILVLAVSFLGGTLEAVGSSLLAIAIGTVAVVVGTRSDRRFTSWAGTAAIVLGVLVLVERAVGESARASAAVLLAIGLAVALGARALEPDGGPGHPTAADEPGPGPTGRSAWPSVPPAAPPSGPAQPWSQVPPRPPIVGPPGSMQPPS
ncbi:MAG TPA: hypothetical protein VHK88_09795 [Aquihabitans sp.]|jgi:hypothetical protein|nr:hypothetical protein [Aquihabitans sp.]